MVIYIYTVQATNCQYQTEYDLSTWRSQLCTYDDSDVYIYGENMYVVYMNTILFTYIYI